MIGLQGVYLETSFAAGFCRKLTRIPESYQPPLAAAPINCSLARCPVLRLVPRRYGVRFVGGVFGSKSCPKLMMYDAVCVELQYGLVTGTVRCAIPNGAPALCLAAVLFKYAVTPQG